MVCSDYLLAYLHFFFVTLQAILYAACFVRFKIYTNSENKI